MFCDRPILSLMILTLLTGSLESAHSQSTHSITTSFIAGAAADGNMFDVTTFHHPITVTSIQVNASNSQTIEAIAIYTKPGTFHGFEDDDTPWTLVSQTEVVPLGLNVPTVVDVTDFTLPPNTITGMYATVTHTGPGEPQMHYVEGNQEFSNDHLRLDLGVGIGDLFGYVIEDRTWSGTINYIVDVAP